MDTSKLSKAGQVAALGLVLGSVLLAGCDQCAPTTYTLTTKSGEVYARATARGGAFGRPTVAIMHNGKAVYIPRDQILSITED